MFQVRGQYQAADEFLAVIEVKGCGVGWGGAFVLGLHHQAVHAFFEYDLKYAFALVVEGKMADDGLIVIKYRHHVAVGLVGIVHLGTQGAIT